MYKNNKYIFVIDPADFNRADTNRDGLVDTPEFERSEQGERRGKLRTYFSQHTIYIFSSYYRILIEKKTIIQTSTRQRHLQIIL